MKIILISLLAVITALNHAIAQSWLKVGSAGFTTDTAFVPSIAISSGGTPYVLYCDADHDYNATVMKYVDTGWVLVGRPGFSTGGIGYNSIAIDTGGTPYVVYGDGGSSDRATVMKYMDTGADYSWQPGVLVRQRPL